MLVPALCTASGVGVMPPSRESRKQGGGSHHQVSLESQDGGKVSS